MISVRTSVPWSVLITASLVCGCTLGLGKITPAFDTADEVYVDTGVDTYDTGGPANTEDTQSIPDTEDTEDTQPTSDLDGDGFSIEDGDCDDNDPLIYPTMTDDCDGIDNNCDGTIDENAIGGMYEPNDTPWNGYFLGDYSAGEYTEVQGLITTETDVDIYEFFLDDGWFDDFGVDFELHAIGIQADFGIELWLIENYSGQTEELLMTVNNLNSGGLERGDFEGDWLIDDSGYYEFRVYTISGADCDAHYQLDIWMSP